MVDYEYFKTLCKKYGFKTEPEVINLDSNIFFCDAAFLNAPPYFMGYVQDKGILIFNGTDIFHLDKKIVEKELKKEIKRRKDQLIENKKQELMSDFK